MGRGLLVVGAFAVLAACSGAAFGETVSTGHLSALTTRLICEQGGADFRDQHERGYGCQSPHLTISCTAETDCIAIVRDLNSYIGNATNVFLRNHNMEQMERSGPGSE